MMTTHYAVEEQGRRGGIWRVFQNFKTRAAAVRRGKALSARFSDDWRHRVVRVVVEVIWED
jgi:hypothetical protein